VVTALCTSTKLPYDRPVSTEIVSCRSGRLSQYVTGHPGQLSLSIPSWVGAMNTSQRVVTPCSWRVKAGVVRVWVAGKTV